MAVLLRCKNRNKTIVTASRENKRGKVCIVAYVRENSMHACRNRSYHCYFIVLHDVIKQVFIVDYIFIFVFKYF